MNSKPKETYINTHKHLYINKKQEEVKPLTENNRYGIKYVITI